MQMSLQDWFMGKYLNPFCYPLQRLLLGRGERWQAQLGGCGGPLSILHDESRPPLQTAADKQRR